MINKLTDRDKQVLEYVKENPLKTPTEIAKALGLSNSSYVAYSVAKLKKMGWIIKYFPLNKGEKIVYEYNKAQEDFRESCEKNICNNNKKTPTLGDIWENDNCFAFVISQEEIRNKNYIHIFRMLKKNKNIDVYVCEIEKFILYYKYKGESTLYGKNFFKRLFEVKCNHEIVETDSLPSEYEPSLVYFRGVCKKCGEVVFGTKEK
jgi:DNA-binding MarR family transcriptional regulator